MEQMAGDGDLIKDPETGTFTVAAHMAAQTHRPARGVFLLSGDAQLLRTLSRVASRRGWATSAEVAEITGVDARSVGKTFSRLAERDLVERWAPGIGASLYRLTSAGHQVIAA
jgi:RIO-like serine/threonine protein kinase